VLSFKQGALIAAVIGIMIHSRPFSFRMVQGLLHVQVMDFLCPEAWPSSIESMHCSMVMGLWQHTRCIQRVCIIRGPSVVYALAASRSCWVVPAGVCQGSWPNLAVILAVMFAGGACGGVQLHRPAPP